MSHKHNWKFAESRSVKRLGYAYDAIIYVLYCTLCGELKEESKLDTSKKKLFG